MISKDNIFLEPIKLLDYSELDYSKKAQFFTDFIVEKSICVPTNNGKPFIICDSVACIDISDCKVIDTIKGTSLEGQHLSSKKLLIMGTVTFTVYFYIPCIPNYLFDVDEEAPFSVFIIVPENASKDGILKLRYMIEDVTATLLTNTMLFFNASIFIQYLENS
ncbi:SPOCS domain-containing protein [Clostridium sp.]